LLNSTIDTSLFEFGADEAYVSFPHYFQASIQTLTLSHIQLHVQNNEFVKTHSIILAQCSACNQE